MDLPAFIDVIAAETDRTVEVLGAVDPAAVVPAAPGWTAADLAWHLGEVQRRFATVIADHLPDPSSVGRPQRPDGVDAVAHLSDQRARLVQVLRDADPDEPCWTFLPIDGTVGWAARRQAHEALIHRVDAEQTAGIEVTDADLALADDGIDEVVGTMLAVAPWATLAHDGASVRLDTLDSGSVWTLRLGRMTGVDPASDRELDCDHAQLMLDDAGPAQTTALVSGTAWAIDRWLWGRLDVAGVDVEGRPEVARRLRRIVTR